MNNNVPINHNQVQEDNRPMGDDIKQRCQRYMSFQVIAQMNDGSQFDGVIVSMDEDGVTILISEEVDEEQENRQFGFGYDDYNDDYYGRPRRRFRRFHRRRFPFSFFRRLFLYPYYPWF
ncbi:hypothetical protein [Virgibacillus sp. DJP39]|uniref:hypothetical protein n=1 Tax=Virgibacillus sp. DJP39 TaxID=3409790 RepID=UPI003BB7D692